MLLREPLIGITGEACGLGFAGAFRRSELVGLGCEDLQFSEASLVVTLRRSAAIHKGHAVARMVDEMNLILWAAEIYAQQRGGKAT